jgi:hypothetical protein
MKGKNAESMEGRILERIALFEQLTHLVDDLFRMYINIRAPHLERGIGQNTRLDRIRRSSGINP